MVGYTRVGRADFTIICRLLRDCYSRRLINHKLTWFLLQSKSSPDYCPRLGAFFTACRHTFGRIQTLPSGYPHPLVSRHRKNHTPCHSNQGSNLRDYSSLHSSHTQTLGTSKPVNSDQHYHKSAKNYARASIE